MCHKPLLSHKIGRQPRMEHSLFAYLPSSAPRSACPVRLSSVELTAVNGEYVAKLVSQYEESLKNGAKPLSRWTLVELRAKLHSNVSSTDIDEFELSMTHDESDRYLKCKESFAPQNATHLEFLEHVISVVNSENVKERDDLSDVTQSMPAVACAIAGVDEVLLDDTQQPLDEEETLVESEFITAGRQVIDDIIDEILTRCDSIGQVAVDCSEEESVNAMQVKEAPCAGELNQHESSEIREISLCESPKITERCLVDRETLTLPLEDLDLSFLDMPRDDFDPVEFRQKYDIITIKEKPPVSKPAIPAKKEEEKALSDKSVEIISDNRSDLIPRKHPAKASSLPRLRALQSAVVPLEREDSPDLQINPEIANISIAKAAEIGSKSNQIFTAEEEASLFDASGRSLLTQTLAPSNVSQSKADYGATGNFQEGNKQQQNAKSWLSRGAQQAIDYGQKIFSAQEAKANEIAPNNAKPQLPVVQSINRQGSVQKVVPFSRPALPPVPRPTRPMPNFKVPAKPAPINRQLMPVTQGQHMAMRVAPQDPLVSRVMKRPAPDDTPALQTRIEHLASKARMRVMQENRLTSLRLRTMNEFKQHHQRAVRLEEEMALNGHELRQNGEWDQCVQWLSLYYQYFEWYCKQENIFRERQEELDKLKVLQQQQLQQLKREQRMGPVDADVYVPRVTHDSIGQQHPRTINQQQQSARISNSPSLNQRQFYPSQVHSPLASSPMQLNNQRLMQGQGRIVEQQLLAEQQRAFMRNQQKLRHLGMDQNVAMPSNDAKGLLGLRVESEGDNFKSEEQRIRYEQMAQSKALEHQRHVIQLQRQLRHNRAQQELRAKQQPNGAVNAWKDMPMQGYPHVSNESLGSRTQQPNTLQQQFNQMQVPQSKDQGPQRLVSYQRFQLDDVNLITPEQFQGYETSSVKSKPASYSDLATDVYTPPLGSVAGMQQRLDPGNTAKHAYITPPSTSTAGSPTTGTVLPSLKSLFRSSSR